MLPKRVSHRDDETAVLFVRVPGWLKERVVEAADRDEVSINSWVANIVRLAVLAGQGVPTPPPASAPIPSAQLILEGILTGLPTLEPCGKTSPCERVKAGTDWLDEMEFCRHCQIRVF